MTCNKLIFSTILQVPKNKNSKKHRTSGFINCIQTIDVIVFEKFSRWHQRFKGFLVALLAVGWKHDVNPTKKSPGNITMFFFELFQKPKGRKNNLFVWKLLVIIVFFVFFRCWLETLKMYSKQHFPVGFVVSRLGGRT